MPSFSFTPFMVSEKKICLIFFDNLPFKSPQQPIKSSDLGESHMKLTGLSNKHICENKSNNSNERAEVMKFHFSHYKSMETISCHSNQSSYPTGTKNITFRSPIPIAAICGIWKESASRLQRRCRLKMLTDGQRTDRRRMPVHTISTP